MSIKKPDPQSGYAFVRAVLTEIQSGKFDVSTMGKTALFYSGNNEKNRVQAMEMYRRAGGPAGRYAIIDETPGGRQLAKRIAEQGLSWPEARTLWGALSTQYARGISGVAIAFVDRASEAAVFAQTEWRELVNNPRVTNVISNEKFIALSGPNAASGPLGRLITPRSGYDKVSLY